MYGLKRVGPSLLFSRRVGTLFPGSDEAVSDEGVERLIMKVDDFLYLRIFGTESDANTILKHLILKSYLMTVIEERYKERVP